MAPPSNAPASLRPTPGGGLQVFGWDIGGAHVKAALCQAGRVVDAMQWACPLWQGLAQLDPVLQAALQRWPQLQQPASLHALTMSGEMVDAFAQREDGVQAICQHLARALAPATVRIYAGDGGDADSTGRSGWCSPAQAQQHWAAVASANWLATARHLALASPPGRGAGAGVLVDIGSTTTDLIAFAHGRVLTSARSDHERLAGGELVYQGVARTPLCALGPALPWRGRLAPLMNEFFATTADVYRLTGELDPAHDLHPTADQGAKDLPATRQRLARMLGLDARDASIPEWQALAQAWRARQLQDLATALQQVLTLHGLAPGSGLQLVQAGCGEFLVPALAAALQAPGHPGALMEVSRYARWALQPAAADPGLLTRVQVAAPAVAVAALLAREEA